MTVGGRGVGVLVGVLVAAFMAVMPLAGAQAAGDLVVWPTAEEINPKVTPYRLTINDPEGFANLVARWDIDDQDYRELLLPHEGTVDLPFAETFVHNRDTTVRIFRCVNATWSEESCVQLDYNWITVWVEAGLASGGISKAGTSPTEFSFEYRPVGLGTSTWRLLAADGSEVQAGQTPLGPGGQLTLAVPLGTPEQLGTFEITSSLDGTAVGHLDGRWTTSVQLDGVPPPPPVLAVSGSVVYPHEDGYLDTVRVTMQTPGARTAVLRAVDQTTGASHVVDEQVSERSATFNFDGLTNRGHKLPAAIYRLEATSYDAAGETSSSSEPIEVRWDELRMVTWRHTIPAAKTVIKKYTGPCGTLSKPAEPGWRGSLGYYSGTCRDPDKAFVQVIHGLNLPPSFHDKYAALRVSLTGGPNKRRPGSYLVLGYFTDAKKWAFENRRVFRGRGIQTHKGDSASRQTMKFIHDDGKGPYVAWSTGLSQGSRYDVKSFTVTIRYQALVPGSK
ncbi:MAG: hypothetical protein ABIR39_04440 [Nocardioides sp.]|uniref:hypothetical protein n=1 Tax=Nocardioides sp. TaxID=35761 RepID=UPI0032662293